VGHPDREPAFLRPPARVCGRPWRIRCCAETTVPLDIPIDPRAVADAGLTTPCACTLANGPASPPALPPATDRRQPWKFHANLLRDCWFEGEPPLSGARMRTPLPVKVRGQLSRRVSRRRAGRTGRVSLCNSWHIRRPSLPVTTDQRMRTVMRVDDRQSGRCQLPCGSVTSGGAGVLASAAHRAARARSGGYRA
jgi:hypothetical protein